MDNVAIVTERQPDTTGQGMSMSLGGVTRTLTVTATYLLSEDGRKTSLLMGGDGREVQQLAIDVLAGRQVKLDVEPRSLAVLADPAERDRVDEDRAAHHEREARIPAVQRVEEADDLRRLGHARDQQAAAEQAADHEGQHELHRVAARSTGR